MNQRVYYGHLNPNQISNALVARFHRGNLRAQKFGAGEQVVVQIATRSQPASGGLTALTVTLQQIKDGVVVQIGKQAWLGVAASLGVTALSALRNPFTLLGRLDDIAQDFENLTLTDQVWETIDEVARTLGASLDLNERLRRLVCEYCHSANPLEEPTCVACGAPLGRVQPRACMKCGFVLRSGEFTCPNCGQGIARS
jgi:hypothetical protein